MLGAMLGAMLGVMLGAAGTSTGITTDGAIDGNGTGKVLISALAAMAGRATMPKEATVEADACICIAVFKACSKGFCGI